MLPLLSSMQRSYSTSAVSRMDVEVTEHSPPHNEIYFIPHSHSFSVDMNKKISPLEEEDSHLSALHPVSRLIQLGKRKGEPFGATFCNVLEKIYIVFIDSKHQDGRTYTPAFRAGLMFGDEILSVNKESYDKESLPSLKKILTSLDKVSLEVLEHPLERNVNIDPKNEQRIRHLQGRLGVGYCGAQVINLKPGSFGAMSEIQLRDTIISVKGHSLVGEKDEGVCRAVVEALRSGEPFDIKVIKYKGYHQLLQGIMETIKQRPDYKHITASALIDGDFVLDKAQEITSKSKQATRVIPDNSPSTFSTIENRSEIHTPHLFPVSVRNAPTRRRGSSQGSLSKETESLKGLVTPKSGRTSPHSSSSSSSGPSSMHSIIAQFVHHSHGKSSIPSSPSSTRPNLPRSNSNILSMPSTTIRLSLPEEHSLTVQPHMGRRCQSYNTLNVERVFESPRNSGYSTTIDPVSLHTCYRF